MRTTLLSFGTCLLLYCQASAQTNVTLGPGAVVDASSYGIAIGSSAVVDVSTGGIAIGRNSYQGNSYGTSIGAYTSAGQYSLAFGYDVDAPGGYSGAFGNNLNVTAANQFVIGRYNAFESNYGSETPLFLVSNGTSGSSLFNAFAVFSNGSVRVKNQLEVAGQIKILGGTPGASKVLTSDASGLASWQSPPWSMYGGDLSFITGNVGVGTNSPSARLDVSSAYQQLRLAYNGSYSGSFFVNSTGDINYTSIGGDEFDFWNGVAGIRYVDIGQNGSSEKQLRIFNAGTPTVLLSSTGNSFFSAGNVGFGTTAPGSKVSINTPGGTSSSGAEWSAHALAITTGTAGRTLWFGYDEAANAGYINAAGNSQTRPILIQSRGGTVAIGTAAPDTSKVLHVNGAVKIDGAVTLGTVSGDISMGAFQ